jgi:hypothetical protein
MKTPTPFLLIAGAALLSLAANLHSQAPVPKSALEQLRALKAKNAEIIEKQNATALKLDEIQKQAEQMRFMGARG